MPQAASRFPRSRVIVTGAASGIGLATARRFLNEGARVILADRDTDALAQVMRDLDPAFALRAETDISRPADVTALHALCLERFDGLDILVNNAGVTAPGTILDSGLETWGTVCATVLTGTIDMCRTFLPLLAQSRGSVVNVASVSGMRGDWNTAYYDIAKAGVVNLTRVMAMDHGHTGVRINAICPAVTLTGMTREALEDTSFVKAVEARVPLGRIGRPEDMAAAITFLASDDAAYITGLIMPVDGGVTTSNGQAPFPRP